MNIQMGTSSYPRCVCVCVDELSCDSHVEHQITNVETEQIADGMEMMREKRGKRRQIYAAHQVQQHIGCGRVAYWMAVVAVRARD